MSEDFDKYLTIANHDIQMANNMGELKSYVASILWDNDKKVELLQQKENIIKEVRKKLIKSKEYQAVKSLGLNSKMSVLIELEEMLEKEKIKSDTN